MLLIHPPRIQPTVRYTKGTIMSPEQIEGYLRRLELNFVQREGEGLDGKFVLGFDTRNYSAVLPPGGKQVRLILAIQKQGRILSVQAPFLYDATNVADPAALYECLLDINYAIDACHFEVDRRDGEVRCATSIPIQDSNLSLEAFKKVLFAIPAAVDHFDARIRKCLRKPAKKTLPRPQAPSRETAPLAEAVNRLTKVVEALVAKPKASRARPSKPRRPAAKWPKPGGAKPADEGNGSGGMSV